MPPHRFAARTSQTSTNLIEGAAISGSLLCLMHCLALPVLLLLVPGTMMLFVQSESFHVLALLFLAPSAALAFWLGYRRHRMAYVALLGAMGIVALGAALIPGIGEGGEVALTVAGSVLLILGHLANWRLRS